LDAISLTSKLTPIINDDGNLIIFEVHYLIHPIKPSVIIAVSVQIDG